MLGSSKRTHDGDPHDLAVALLRWQRARVWTMSGSCGRRALTAFRYYILLTLFWENNRQRLDIILDGLFNYLGIISGCPNAYLCVEFDVPLSVVSRSMSQLIVSPLFRKKLMPEFTISLRFLSGSILWSRTTLSGDFPPHACSLDGGKNATCIAAKRLKERQPLQRFFSYTLMLFDSVTGVGRGGQRNGSPAVEEDRLRFLYDG